MRRTKIEWLQVIVALVFIALAGVLRHNHLPDWSTVALGLGLLIGLSEVRTLRVRTTIKDSTPLGY